MLENAEKVREQFSALIDKAESASELETLKIEYLGKKGRVAALMSGGDRKARGAETHRQHRIV